MREHQLPALCTVHPSRCCTAAALHPPGCPHAASLLLEPFSRQPAAFSADVTETRAGRCRQPLPEPSPNLPTKLWDSRPVQILERMRRSKGCKRVWYGKPAPTEAYRPLKELRANKRGAGEGFPSSRCRAPSIRPCEDSAGWHWPSDGAHFPQGPVSPPRRQAGASGHRSGPALCCGKSSRPGSALPWLKRPRFHSVPVPKPQGEQLYGAQGVQGTISSLSHAIFWGVWGPYQLYPTLYIGSTSSLPRKRPKLGELRVSEQAGGAGSVPGITEIRDEDSAPLLPEQSKSC